MSAESYTLTVNGVEREVVGAHLGENLLHVLRERLGLPGAKAACEQGECGSCLVTVDGVLVCSCLVLAATARGSEIVTPEGLQPPEPGALSRVQQALVDHGGVQCGFCTPGLVMSVTDLLAREPAPTRIEIEEAISGNLCRCTGYGRIVAAVEALAEAAGG